jgi:hypothetical protein
MDGSDTAPELSRGRRMTDEVVVTDRVEIVGDLHALANVLTMCRGDRRGLIERRPMAPNSASTWGPPKSVWSTSGFSSRLALHLGEALRTLRGVQGVNFNIITRAKLHQPRCQWEIAQFFMNQDKSPRDASVGGAVIVLASNRSCLAVMADRLAQIPGPP